MRLLRNCFLLYALCPKQFLNSRIVNSTTNMPASPTPSFPIFSLFHLSPPNAFFLILHDASEWLHFEKSDRRTHICSSSVCKINRLVIKPLRQNTFNVCNEFINKTCEKPPIQAEKLMFQAANRCFSTGKLPSLAVQKTVV